MALPNQIKNKLDALYDIIINENNDFVYDKISIGPSIFKIRIRKENIDGKLKFQIDIIER